MLKTFNNDNNTSGSIRPKYVTEKVVVPDPVSDGPIFGLDKKWQLNESLVVSFADRVRNTILKNLRMRDFDDLKETQFATMKNIGIGSTLSTEENEFIKDFTGKLANSLSIDSSNLSVAFKKLATDTLLGSLSLDNVRTTWPYKADKADAMKYLHSLTLNEQDGITKERAIYMINQKITGLLRQFATSKQKAKATKCSAKGIEYYPGTVTYQFQSITVKGNEQLVMLKDNEPTEFLIFVHTHMNNMILDIYHSNDSLDEVLSWMAMNPKEENIFVTAYTRSSAAGGVTTTKAYETNLESTDIDYSRMSPPSSPPPRAS